MPSHPTFRPMAGSLFALSLLSAGPAAAVPAIASHAYTASELRNYAETLVAIVRVRQALATQLTGAPSGSRAQLESEATAQITEILQRHDLDKAAFNAISARVETQPGIRRQVNQMVMDEVIRG